MASTTATLLLPGGTVTVTVTGEAEGDALWLAPAELEKAGGWEFRPEGACRGPLCVPVPPGAAWVRGAGPGLRVDLTGLSRHMGQPVAVSAPDRVWSIGEAAEDAADRLASLDAPDFTLPDLEGRPHTLSSFRGRKVFVLAWASW
jgi:hypothetical protein